jgi:hypothetical protein
MVLGTGLAPFRGGRLHIADAIGLAILTEWVLALRSPSTNCFAKIGLKLADFERVEIKKAFAVQVLACSKAMASDEFGI